MNSDPSNAIAGQSSSHSHAPEIPSTNNFSMSPSSPSSTARPPPAPSIPPLYLPPQGPPPPQTFLASTQDLISRFNLLPAYDKYVRQNVTPAGEPSVPGPSGTGLPDQLLHSAQGPIASVPGAMSSGVGGLDKGKGKEVAIEGGVSLPVMSGQGMAAGADEDAKAEKKKKNSYKHLIKGIPGKHSTKKDDYLSTMMLVPPKQRIPIVPFDARTQRDAFTVTLEGLKGWNIYALMEEPPQAKEDRKKRKELKRLAKAQVVALAAHQAGLADQGQPVHAPVPTAAQSRQQAAGSPNGVSTPRPTGSSTPRPGSTVPRPGATTTATGLQTATPTPIKVQVRSPSDVPRPDSQVPRPKPAVPRPGSTKPPAVAMPAAAPTQLPARPVPGATTVGTPLRSGTPMQVDQQRGKKREREDGMVNGVTAGHGLSVATVTSATPVAVVDSKASAASVKPRPIKKQRMDMQGQARDATAPVQQQPTPQGV